MSLGALTHPPRETRDTLFLLLLVGWIVLPLLNHLPLWCSLLTGGVLLWRGTLAITGRPLPSRWVLLALLAAALAGTWYSHRSIAGRDPGVTLVMTLLALKTLELRAKRDTLVVFFLGFFAMLTNFLYSQSLPVAAAMLVALLGLLTALVNAHRPVGQPSLRESAAVALKMALAGVPVMLALFMLFPRLAPLWSLPSDAMAGRSGLSSTMEVGALARLALDDGIVMRIKFDRAPPPSELYFRGPVLSRFNGRTWSAADRADAFDAAPAPGPAELSVSGAPLRYEVTLEPSNHPWLLTLDVTPQAPEMPSGRRARMTADMQWMVSAPVTDLLRYRAESYLQYRYGLRSAGGQPWRDFSRWLRLPDGFNPRTVAMAEALRRQIRDANNGADDAPALVRAALQRLRSGGYSYTLEPGVSGQHSADEFWFDTKAGFCEHIASAFVVLMRAAGVPARIVTGFPGGETNPVDGYWTVRNTDAHAWAEVWVAGQGWVRVDPTGAVAPARVGQYQRLHLPDGLLAGALNNLSPSLLAQLRAAWEALNNGWNQWVLNYTQSRQFAMLKNLGFQSPSWQDLVKTMAGLLIAAVLASIAWAYWERGQHDPWLRLLARARNRLRQAGIDAPPQAPPRELLRRVQASRLPAGLRQTLADWLLALERIRYAPATAPQRATLAALRRQFRQIDWPSRNKTPR
ncbi:MAG: DUF3488 and transglutaminase-like domain-containing protein [Burkholderiaceae bacterium]|jgi:transglutaminase-like putative cysteine protease|nr:DUF3488 and transglutaminase-like domain-containing protein [Burkholderiaceae bacterium]